MARMTADDFRAELAALANGLRRTIEADCASFPADAKASAQRVRRVQGDFPFFRRTYFPHYTRRKAVHHPGSVIPPRPFLGVGEDHKTEMRRLIVRHLRKAVRGA